MNTRDLFKLLLLATIWGSSFLLIRIAAPALGPVGLVTARMLIAGGALVLFAMATRRALPSLRAEWRTYLALGALNSAVPLTLEAFALLHLSASLGAILASTTPLWTAMGAALWLGERLSLRAIAGLALGMAGVVAIVGWSELALTGVVLLALGLALLSAVLYALGGIYARAAVRRRSPLALTIGQELSAGVLLLPLALAAPPPGPLSLPEVVATVTLALLVTAGGTLLYFDLLARLGPTRTQSVGFLVPGVALLLGVLLLGEPLTGGMVLGLGLVLASVGLVTGHRHVTWRRFVPRRFRPGAADDAGSAWGREQDPALLGEPQFARQRLGHTAAGYDRQSMRRGRIRPPTTPVGVSL